MYKMLVKDTTTGQCGLADVPCAPEALTPMSPININDSVISLDMLAVAQALGFTDCTGNPVLTGAVVATCSDIADAIAALPADKYLQGLQAYDAATNTLTLLMSDGTTVAVPMSGLLADAWADVTPAQVATKLGLLSCGGAAIPAGTQIATCADLNAAIAAIPGFSGVAANAPLTGNGTAASPLDVNFAALSAVDIAALLTAMNLRTCAGALHTSGSTIPTCAEMNAAIAAAVAALPGDKFLQGLQSYNATTNVLTLLMNDGSTVPVDMTDIVADAVSSVVVVSADAGNLITAGTDGGALLTTGPAAPTSVTGTGCPTAAPTDPSTVYYIDISRDPQVAYFWDGVSWTQLGDHSTGVATTNIYQYNSIETGPTAGAAIFDSVTDLKIDLTPFGFDSCKHNAAWVYARSRRTYDKDTASPLAPDGGRSSFIIVSDPTLSGLRLDAGAITNSATAPGTAVDSISESVGWVPVSDSGEITVSVFVNNHANMTADDRVVTDIDLVLQGFGYLGMARI